ncbi:hypothetical protein WN55_06872 [Dufourea novaeangliae]|uniref:Uncharacterized protein n=1 Tax=Dufourea novaeangliae TaxID=178035 RepID=A0A154PQU4_DUFNO|nr:hypothetical protein WN55_06872 [Dufourea novaeangliae]
MSREESIMEAQRRRALRMEEENGGTITPATWDNWSQEVEVEVGEDKQLGAEEQVEEGEEDLNSGEDNILDGITIGEDIWGEIPPSYSPVTSPISEWDEEMREDDNPTPPLEEEEVEEEEEFLWEVGDDWNILMKGRHYEKKMVGTKGLLVSDDYILVFEREDSTDEAGSGSGAILEELEEGEEDDIIWMDKVSVVEVGWGLWVGGVGGVGVRRTLALKMEDREMTRDAGSFIFDTLLRKSLKIKRKFSLLRWGVKGGGVLFTTKCEKTMKLMEEEVERGIRWRGSKVIRCPAEDLSRRNTVTIWCSHNTMLFGDMIETIRLEHPTLGAEDWVLWKESES